MHTPLEPSSFSTSRKGTKQAACQNFPDSAKLVREKRKHRFSEMRFCCVRRFKQIQTKHSWLCGRAGGGEAAKDSAALALGDEQPELLELFPTSNFEAHFTAPLAPCGRQRRHLFSW